MSIIVLRVRSAYVGIVLVNRIFFFFFLILNSNTCEQQSSTKLIYCFVSLTVGVSLSFLELRRRNDVGDSGLLGHSSGPGDRHQRPGGGAPGLFRRLERNGLGSRAVRLYRRHGTSHRSQATATAQVTASLHR